MAVLQSVRSTVPKPDTGFLTLYIRSLSNQTHLIQVHISLLDTPRSEMGVS